MFVRVYASKFIRFMLMRMGTGENYIHSINNQQDYPNDH